jgi:hypothetical protein
MQVIKRCACDCRAPLNMLQVEDGWPIDHERADFQPQTIAGVFVSDAVSNRKLRVVGDCVTEFMQRNK